MASSVRRCPAGCPMPLRTCFTLSLPPALAAPFLASWPLGLLASALGMTHFLLPRLVADRIRLDAALAPHLPDRHQVRQPVDRRAHDVVRRVGAQALGEDVLDARALEHRAHRTAG